ncbi:MAG: hypothetical protein MI743_00250 [Sneathiellales bacterium]|nr:hypothetical protein [Sneathiellales bacterium]
MSSSDNETKNNKDDDELISEPDESGDYPDTADPNFDPNSIVHKLLLYGGSFLLVSSFFIAKDLIFSPDEEMEAAKPLVAEASMMVEKGYHQSAIKSANKILKLGEMKWEAYYYKAIAHLHRKELQEAYQATLKMQDLTPYGRVTIKGFNAMKNNIQAIGEDKKHLLEQTPEFCINFVKLGTYRERLDLDISGEKCFGKYEFYNLFKGTRLDG